MTKEASILRGLAVFGAAWQVLWLLSQGGLRSIVSDAPSSWPVIALGLSLIAWLALWPSLFGPLRSARRVLVLQIAIIATVYAAGLGLILDIRAVAEDGAFTGANVLLLAVGLSGLYLDRRAGITVVLGMVLIEAIAVSYIHLNGLDNYPLSVDLVYPVYALAVGLAAAASRHALISSARDEDRSTRDLTRQQQARVSAESIDAVVSAAETRLHETVLNTLTAIVRGGLDVGARTRVRIRERAAESADVLQRLASGADVSSDWIGDLATDLAVAVNDLRQRGVRVRLSGTLSPESSPTGEELLAADDAAYRAMGHAVRETLLNAYRHSNASEVTVHGDIVDHGEYSEWRVSVLDDGVGFATEQMGFGLRSVVTDGLAAVGGRAHVDSAPGRGTRIDLQVPMPTRGHADDAVRGPLRSVGAPVLTAFVAFTVFVAGATWTLTARPALNVAALLVFALVVVVLGWAVVSGRYLVAPWWAVVAVVVGVPLMARLERLADAQVSPTGDWSSEAGSALLFVIVAAGPWWVAPLALVSWLTAQGQFLVELTQPGTIVVVIAALLGWSLRRADQRTRRIRSDAEEEQAALAISQQRLSEVRRRYADVDSVGLIALLRAIADGDLDPTQASVRQECARQERMIRTVLPLHPERNLLHRDLVQLAVIARDRGVDLSISNVMEVPADKSLRGIDDASALLRFARPGSSARVSVTPIEHGCIFRLVVTVDTPAETELPPSVEVLDESERLVAYEEWCADAAHAPLSEDVLATDA